MNAGIRDRGLGVRHRLPIQEDTPNSRLDPANNHLPG